MLWSHTILTIDAPDKERSRGTAACQEHGKTEHSESDDGIKQPGIFIKTITASVCRLISELDMVGTRVHIAVSNTGREGGGHLRATAVPSICSVFRLIHIAHQCTNEEHGE